MSPAPVLALWTVPRSASTAFERMMMERGDHTVVHEPFSAHYYYGPGKVSSRYDDTREDATPERILSDITDAAADRPVFVKDMAYHLRDVAPEVRDRVIGEWTHTFLVRDPARSITSFARHWPDPTEDEAGFAALDALVDATTSPDARPVVIDSQDLLTDPDGTVRAWCAATGIPFRADAMSWEPGMREEWGLWEDWHADVATSTGLEPVEPSPPPPVPGELEDLYDQCRPIYERLRNLRIRPQTPS